MWRIPSGSFFFLFGCGLCRGVSPVSPVSQVRLFCGKGTKLWWVGGGMGGEGREDTRSYRYIKRVEYSTDKHADLCEDVDGQDDHVGGRVVGHD